MKNPRRIVLATAMSMILLNNLGCKSDKQSELAALQSNEINDSNASAGRLGPQKLPVDRVEQLIKVVSVTAQSAASHQGKAITNELRQQIYNSVDLITEPRDLKALALTFRALDDYADDFGVAFWRCVDLLAENPSDGAVAALGELDSEIRPESGDKQLFDEAIQHQKEKKAVKR